MICSCVHAQISMTKLLLFRNTCELQEVLVSLGSFFVRHCVQTEATVLSPTPQVMLHVPTPQLLPLQ